jgi:hypothetical protein
MDALLIRPRDYSGVSLWDAGAIRDSNAFDKRKLGWLHVDRVFVINRTHGRRGRCGGDGSLRGGRGN